MKKCVNCTTDLPQDAKFCLNCGAAQPEPQTRRVAVATPSADGSVEDETTRREAIDDGEFNWLAREANLDPTLDYSAAQRYDGLVGNAIGCVVIGFFVVMGLLALIPGVPIMAIFGLPIAVILSVLTFFNVGKLRDKIRSLKFVQKLPGIVSASPAVTSASIFGYLAVISVVCFLIMVASSR
jgi:hypothetical protein